MIGRVYFFLAISALFITGCGSSEDPNGNLPTTAELCQRCESSIPETKEFSFTIRNDLDIPATIIYNGYVGECFTGEPLCTGWLCTTGKKESITLNPGELIFEEIESVCVDELFFCLMIIEYDGGNIENRFGRSNELEFDFLISYNASNQVRVQQLEN